MTDVYFSPRASRHSAPAERLAEESELKSSIFRSRLADAARSLSIFPERGRKRDDLNPGYRSIPVEPVVIAYRIDADAVEVVRVIDGAGTSARSSAAVSIRVAGLIRQSPDVVVREVVVFWTMPEPE